MNLLMLLLFFFTGLVSPWQPPPGPRRSPNQTRLSSPILHHLGPLRAPNDAVRMATGAAMSSPRFGGRAWACDGRIRSASSFSGLLFLLLRPLFRDSSLSLSLSPLRLASRLGSEIYLRRTFLLVKSTSYVALHGTPRFASHVHFGVWSLPTRRPGIYVSRRFRIFPLHTPKYNQVSQQSSHLT
jgi:hypothetical protein